MVALIGVGGTLVGALGGGLLTWWLGQRTEHRHWRREHCLGAFTDVLAVCESVGFEADRLYGLERGTQEHLQAMLLLLERVAAMYRAGDRVALLGSSEVTVSCVALTSYAGSVLAPASYAVPKPPAVEWRTIRSTDYARFYGQFQSIARGDLDLKS